MASINQLVCNKCSLPKRSDARYFYLTQCGHIFCHQCTSKTGTCPRCQTPGIQTVELSEPLPLSIVHLFTPRHEFLQNMTNVANFQFNQMAISEKLSQQKGSKYNELKRMYWEQRKALLKIQQMKQKLTASTDELLTARQNYYQQATNSATSDGTYIQPENFFRQDNAVPNKFSHVKPNQRFEYPFGRKVAFVNPSSPYDTVSSGETYSPSTNTPFSMNTPGSMNAPITPETVIRMANYRRVHKSAGNSSATSSNTSSNMNLF